MSLSSGFFQLHQTRQHIVELRLRGAEALAQFLRGGDIERAQAIVVNDAEIVDLLAVNENALGVPAFGLDDDFMVGRNGENICLDEGIAPIRQQLEFFRRTGDAVRRIEAQFVTAVDGSDMAGDLVDVRNETGLPADELRVYVFDLLGNDLLEWPVAILSLVLHCVVGDFDGVDQVEVAGGVGPAADVFDASV
jgi:hypothetical protein